MRRRISRCFLSQKPSIKDGIILPAIILRITVVILAATLVRWRPAAEPLTMEPLKRSVPVPVPGSNAHLFPQEQANLANRPESTANDLAELGDQRHQVFKLLIAAFGELEAAVVAHLQL